MVLLAGGVYYLSIMAERKARDYQMYRGDYLIQAIHEHHQNSKGTSYMGSAATTEPPANQERVIIHHGGKTEIISNVVKPPQTKPIQEPLPTNEGQPGQPLPLSQQPPANPVYK